MFVAAQENQAAEWIRVQSDNGEFSVEVPAEYGFFADKYWFSVSDGSSDYLLQEVKILNTYREKTLISFESYKTKRNVADIFRDRDSRNGESSEIKRNGFSVKQISIKNDKFYVIRQYISTKNYVYVLTAASRNGETPAMKHFLESLELKPLVSKNSPNNLIPNATLFSALRVSPIEFDENPAPLPKPSQPPVQPPLSKDETALPMTILIKPTPSYINSARMKGEKGTIQIRATFSEQGRIAKIAFLKTLKEGLVRQAVFAALRIKFLPAEKQGKPETVTKIIEYSFDIY